jgi:hypothetical protein
MGILDRFYEGVGVDPYMMKPEPKRYTIKVKDVRNTTPGASMIVYANSVSHAMELFLQDYLKNNRLSVEITEHNVTERKI